MKYIQHPETHELIPFDQYERPRSYSHAPNIMSDINPYRSIVTGEWITSRSKHRQHLKDTNCIEVGNEKPDFMKD